MILSCVHLCEQNRIQTCIVNSIQDASDQRDQLSLLQILCLVDDLLGNSEMFCFFLFCFCFFVKLIRGQTTIYIIHGFVVHVAYICLYSSQVSQLMHHQVMWHSIKKLNKLLQSPYFLEVNLAPTLRPVICFYFSFLLQYGWHMLVVFEGCRLHQLVHGTLIS